MTEKQTTQESTDFLAEGDVAKFNNWAGKEDYQEDLVAAAARRTVEVDSTPTEAYKIPVSHSPDTPPAQAEGLPITTSQTPDTLKTREISPRVKRNRGNLAAAAAVGVSVAGVLGVAYHVTSAPEFSEQTTTFTAESGDGVFDAAQKIKGLDDMNDGIEYIKSDPANTDVLEDGLQLNEQLVIPVSVAGHENDKE